MQNNNRLLTQTLAEMKDHLENGIIPFWAKRAKDREMGGYFSCFDSQGNPTGVTVKHIVSQTRFIWGFSAFYRYFRKEEFLDLARHGYNFFTQMFKDPLCEGWYTSVSRDGKPLDKGKSTYAHSFAIYGLAEYYLAANDANALAFAEQTFDVLQKYAADVYYGGYYEHFNEDWDLLVPERTQRIQKGLDAHMHLMESFTSLFEASGKAIHKRKLQEVIDVLLNRMIDPASGCGMSVFDSAFTPMPQLHYRFPERGQEFYTNYGHNVELAWLLNRAGKVLGLQPDYFDSVNRGLIDHSLSYGFDNELGGIYHVGLYQEKAHGRFRVWWENAEVLVGYLDAYERWAEEKYLHAFLSTWDFDKKYFIHKELGEWYGYLDEQGMVQKGDLGWEWKVLYHTARSMMECMLRLKRIIERTNSK